MAPRVRKFVCREFIKTVDLDLFRRFLEPHSAGIGVRWDELPEDDLEKRNALFELFRNPDNRFPPALQNALHCAKILSTESGSRILLDQAEQWGVSLVPRQEIEGPEDGRHLTPRHLALRAYLDHRKIFDRAVDLAAMWSVPSLLERSGAREGVAARYDDLIAREELRAAASAYFASRYNGSYCDLRWYPDDDEIGLLVLHGRTPRTANVEEEGQERTLSYREIAEDTIRYHPESGRIKIGACCSKDALKLLELFATHLIGEPSFFARPEAEDLYTLEPLRLAGADFRFHCGWDEDLERVLVREIRIDEGEHEVNGRRRFSPWSCTVKDSQNALRRLAETADGVCLEDLRISQVQLEFHFRLDGKTARIPVKVKPPSIASFRDHTFEASILTHLERNGLRRVRGIVPSAAAAV